MRNCDKGYNGHCCCNCKNRRKLMCHPWNGANQLNETKFGMGPITQQCGWVCLADVRENGESEEVGFMDFEHGICELHEPKD